MRLICYCLFEKSDSGHEIRCDVFIDRIRTVSIMTRTKTVYVDDAPEILEVSAFDNEGLYTPVLCLMFK